jgi:peptide/nickel transport system permease protein
MRRGAARRLAAPLALIGAIALAALAAPILPLPDPTAIDVRNRFAGPSWAHWLGQDEFGRDVLARIVWGGRASLAVAAGAAVIAAALGTALGLLGGYFRGIVELLTARAAEVVLCLPPLLLALLVVTLLGPGAGTLVIALSILYTPGFVRVAYAATLQTRSLDFVTAQEAIGTHPVQILARTVLPNVAPPLLVQLSLTVASAVVIESGLSFLGLGVVPPAPSWGLMIRGARGAMDAAPLLLVWPCVALTVTILAFNLLCDRLRDALDPKPAPEGGTAWLRRPDRRPSAASAPAEAADDALLDLRGLTVTLGDGPDATPLVREASLSVRPGETLALVGESGSGKTLCGLSLMGLLPGGLSIAGGSAAFRGRDGAARDLLALSEREARSLRGDEIAMVFQDATAALSPSMRIGDQVVEAILAHRAMSLHAARAEAVALLRRVGLPDPESRARAWPHELSGGQRQRAMIAVAVANGPRLLIADEPTTALDPTIQAQILTLLDGLKTADGAMAMIFVTHNLAIVAEIADRVCVMYAGEVVETGPVAEVFAAPRHPYTAALLASVPEGDAPRLEAIPGVVPAPGELPDQCRFAPRCAHAAPGCVAARPALETGPDRAVRCVRWRELACATETA